MMRRAPITLIMHVALAIILAGAMLTHFLGTEGSITLDRDQAKSSFSLADGTEQPLPFTLRLDSCYIVYHAGTTAPADFYSILSAGGQTYTVHMNHIATIQGYRFCQSAMGHDSSTLCVNHDPVGIPVTYTGYALLLASMLLYFVQRHTGFRALARRAAAVALIGLCAIPATAQQHVPEDVAREFGKLYVLWGDRITPMESMARDFCADVSGRSSWHGADACQVMLGWILDYDSWKKIPFIKVSGSRVKQALGIDGSYAALQDFFDVAGYKLQPLLDDVADRDVQQANRRVQLVISVCTGRAVRIYPYYSALGRMEWLSWVDQRPSQMPLEQWQWIATSMEQVARDMAYDRNAEATAVLADIHARQIGLLAAHGAAPSEVSVGAELMFNRFSRPLAAGIIILIAVGVLALPCARRRGIRAVGLAAVAYLSFILSLRWIITGHVPLTNGPETMQFMSWVAAIVAVAARRGQMCLYALLVSAVTLMVSGMGQGGDAAISPLMPVLGSPLLSVHVVAVMMAYVLLALIALNSLVSACRRSGIQKELAKTSLRLLYPAVFLLAAGIFIGAVWANESWGRYWGWDPKETWALITMLVYAVPLHWRSLRWLRHPRSLNIYLAAAFLLVLFTYFGVNYLLPGLHSYA